jgi:glycosyltransferase involved in cell wall biosynthesis
MPNPFFSIITVTYNSSKYVRDAIESVLASTYSDFELIIGDDCSTDNTWDIINEYSDPRVVKYRNDNNLREYPNRNKALGLARGEWVIFIDGDDVIYCHSLNVLYIILSKSNDIAIAIMCPENPNYIAPLILDSKQLYAIEFSEHGLINRALSHTIYKTIKLKNNPFENGGFIGLDTLNRLQILRNERCLLIQDNLTWWRRSPNQASMKLYCSNKDEMFAMSKLLFNITDCPLNICQQQLYERNAKVKLVWRFLKLNLKLKFSSAVELFKVNDLNLFDLRYAFFRVNKNNPLLEIDEFVRYSIK